jgi:uncharacterized phage protein gp47/JayE
MAYFTPYVDSSGLHLPTYDDILQDLIDKKKTIYGPDIYLGNDSSDYQELAVFALKMYDTLLAVQLAYNSRGPSTAIGSALDVIVKMNGIARKAATYSTAILTITGVASTVITNGVARDVNGNLWDLPSTVTIGTGGTATVTATCQTIGSIAALAGDINTISTPTSGWTAVINGAAATQGNPIETDAELRERQAISVELPSQTMLSGTLAAIAEVTSVTRYKVYENPTNAVDAYGLPEHSITCVVEGGDDDDIADAIYLNRGLGCYVNGDVIVTVNDPIYDVDTTIRFYRPVYVPIYVRISVHPLTGYTTAVEDEMIAAVSDYINGLQIGEGLTLSALYGAALSVIPDLTKPTFSITALVDGISTSPLTAADIAVDYNEVTSCSITSPSQITVIQV